MKKLKTFLLITAGLGLIFCFAYGQEHKELTPTLVMFYSPTCHSCVKVKNEVMPQIEKELQGKLHVEYRNMQDIENVKLLISLQEQYHAKINNSPPIFFLQGHFFNGEQNIKATIEGLLKLSTPSQGTEKISQNSIDPVKLFKSFTPWAIIGVGLIDGINPCAVTVIVFFMSFLAFRGYRKREIALIGLVFISSVYLTYVLIGVGIFEFLYEMRGFWILTKIINITVGVISILFSGYATYDFIKFRKTKSTQDMLLHLPKSIQARIHSVIRSSYGGTTEETSKPAEKKHMFRLAITALITGFLVSVLEAVCVVKIYLPTIVFVLKTTHLKMRALGFLLLYNLLFVFPLLLIFGFALAGTTSEKFAALLKGNLGAIKILMAIMFLCLGIFLLWRA